MYLFVDYVSNLAGYGTALRSYKATNALHDFREKFDFYHAFMAVFYCFHPLLSSSVFFNVFSKARLSFFKTPKHQAVYQFI